MSNLLALIPLLLKVLDIILGKKFKASKVRKSFQEYFKAFQNNKDNIDLDQSEKDQLEDLK